MTFAATVPVLQVSDVATSMRWYEDVLGFDGSAFPKEEPYTFALLCRDGSELMLQSSKEAPIGHGWAVYIRVTGSQLLDLAAHVRARVPLAGAPPAIYVRELDGLGFQPVDDTLNYAPAGLADFCFSPDGTWIAFESGGTLRRAPIRGGPGLIVEEAIGDFLSCDWAEDGHIYFARRVRDGGGIQRIPEAGGSIEDVAIPGADSAGAFRSSELLPGGTKLLILGLRRLDGPPRAPVLVRDLESGESTTLLENAGPVQFVASGDNTRVGHLVFARDDALFAAPFDLERLQVGTASPVVDGVDRIGAISATGTLAYMALKPSAATADVRSIDALDRNGQASTLRNDGRAYLRIALSPDGRQSISVIREPDGAGLFVHDFAGGPLTLLVARASREAVWTPDGRRVIYDSSGAGQRSLESIPVDGSEPPANVWTGRISQILLPTSVSPDGMTLIGTVDGPGDIWRLPLRTQPGETAADDLQHLLRSDAAVGSATFSPDGRWIAYSSNESGSAQVYVIAYPGPGGKRQVTIDGGRQPRWNPAGGELFFLDGSRLMVVEVETEEGFRVVGQPRTLFEDAALAPGQRFGQFQYDVSPDGTQFVMLRRPAESTAASTDRVELHVVQNWFEELNRLVPTN